MTNKKPRPAHPGAPQTLKLAGMMYAQIQDEADARALADDALPQPPESVMARTDSAVHAMLAAQQKAANRRRRTARLVRVAAMVAVVLCVALPLTLTVDATRAVAANFLIQNFDKFSTITYDINNNAEPPIGWTSEYYPQWLPEGYEFGKIALEDGRQDLWYIDDAGYKIYFSLSAQSGVLDIDKENTDSYDTTVLSYNATLYIKDDKRTSAIAIFLPSCTLYIQGPLTKDDILKIANSIHGIS